MKPTKKALVFVGVAKRNRSEDKFPLIANARSLISIKFLDKIK